jgi:hypothetical protein
MRYSTPELVVVGTAASLVQGIPGGQGDNGGSLKSRPADGIALGLDD